MSGMAVAVLQPYGLLHRVLKVLRPDNTEDRHHQLRGNQRMLLGALKGNAADVIRHFHAHHGKQRLGASSHALPVQGALLGKDRRDQLILNFPGSQVAALLLHHVSHELVTDGIHRHDLLLGDAGQVVVKGTSVDDILRRLADIRRLIHQGGGISSSGANASLSAGEHRRNHARSACGNQKGNVRMLHHHAAGIQGRFLHRAGNVIRPSGLQGCLVQKVDGVDGRLDGLGMGVEHHRVSSGQHAHGIAEHGLAGVRAGGNGPDHAEGSHLHQRQSPVARPCRGGNILGSRRLLRHQKVF